MAQNDIVLKVREKGAAKTTSALKRITMAVGGLAAAYITMRSAMALGRFGVDIVKSFTRQDVALRKLSKQVKGSLKLYEDYAAGIQNATLFADEQVIEWLQLAKTYGVADDQLQKVTDSAIGLGTALQMDVGTALRYVTLALEGDYTMLQRYIPTLRTMTDESKKAAAVQKVIGDGLKMAKEEAKAQPWIQLGMAFGDLKEKAGEALAKQIIPSMQTLTAMFKSGEAEEWAKTVGNAFAKVAKVVTDLPGTLDDLKVAFGLMSPEEAEGKGKGRSSAAILDKAKARYSKLETERRKAIQRRNKLQADARWMPKGETYDEIAIEQKKIAEIENRQRGLRSGAGKQLKYFEKNDPEGYADYTKKLKGGGVNLDMSTADKIKIGLGILYTIGTFASKDGKERHKNDKGLIDTIDAFYDPERHKNDKGLIGTILSTDRPPVRNKGLIETIMSPFSEEPEKKAKEVEDAKGIIEAAMNSMSGSFIDLSKRVRQLETEMAMG